MKKTYHYGDILSSFMDENPKKTVFGNFRIEKNRLIFRAQVSTEAASWSDANEFREAKKKIGAMIKDMDGKLVDSESKPVLFESLTLNNRPYGMKILGYETNLVAVKIETADGPLFFGNSELLPLVGRVVAYGREDRNDRQTEIQTKMRNGGWFMVPLSQLDGLDFSSFEVIEKGNETAVVSVTEDIGNSWRNRKTIDSQVMVSPSLLFKLGGVHYLADVDRRETRYGRVKPYLAQVSTRCKTVEAAREYLKPARVREAEAKGIKVVSIADVYFIATKAPTVPTLTDLEKITLLASKVTYSMDSKLVESVIGFKVSENEGKEILGKVVRPLSVGGIEVTRAINLDGETYCNGKISLTDYAPTNLDGWFIAVQADKRKVEITDENED